ncbi:hypothetical protein Cob_v002445 [Colletotrichum orbiculare MAFF 240422]|uniref:Uncharacterized protein n=1 Tax=Colletotrichum orbiculare (strain 104-T / ATCC 96160 / CBS 514.97 / LARS 414 / MAFF 240422) TaxID=1213857 RepID=N4V9I7_COLOR|nr:hypothetical protein Cob_v002445 [Colletotrichum orbiculare MAFF 240422]
MKTTHLVALFALLTGTGLAAPIDTLTSPNPASRLAQRQLFYLNCTSQGLRATCLNYNTYCNSYGGVSTGYVALCGEPNCRCEFQGGCDTICREAQKKKEDGQLNEEAEGNKEEQAEK